MGKEKSPKQPALLSPEAKDEWAKYQKNEMGMASAMLDQTAADGSKPDSSKNVKKKPPTGAQDSGSEGNGGGSLPPPAA